MKYITVIDKKYHYIKVYRIIKRVNENTNALSKIVASLVDKYLVGKKEEER